MKLAFNGMMYEVQSKMVPLSGEDIDGPKVIDLVENYGLVELDNINSVAMFDEYMEQYMDRLIGRVDWIEEFLSDDEEDEELMSDGEVKKRVDYKKVYIGSLKSNIEAMMDQIRSRFSGFKFYTGMGSSGIKNGLTLPGGSLVLADTAVSDPPTFYYLAAGMRGIHNLALEQYLLSHPSLLYSYDDKEDKE